MGIPAPSGVGAAGTPPAGDQANAVVSGQFSALGVSTPFAFYGAFNLAIWGSVSTTLTTTAGSTAATVASGTGLVVGRNNNSASVPKGTTIGVVAGTNVTLKLPPGIAAAGILAGTAVAAVFATAVWDATVQLERSFDGGATYVTCGIGGAGQPAVYTGTAQAGQAVSIVAAEPERQVLYRLNCTVYASGTINYRMSATGLAAVAWGVPLG